MGDDGDDTGDVYRDRNLLAVAFAAAVADAGGAAGRYDDPDADEFVVVWAETDLGRVAWKVAADMVPASLPDEHTSVHTRDRGRRNRRLAWYAGLVDAEGTPKRTVRDERAEAAFGTDAPGEG